MLLLNWFLFFVLGGFATQTAWPGVVDAKDDPAREVLLENDKTTVIRTELQASAATRLHAHNGFYLQIALTAGAVSNEVQGRPVRTLQLEPGELRSVRGNFAHLLRNVGAEPYRQISVQVKRAQPANAEIAPFSPAVESFRFRDGSSGELLEESGIRAYIIHIAESGLFHRHGHDYDHLLIALTDIVLQESSNEGARMVQLRAGEVLWRSQGSTHTVSNVGKGPAVFIVIDFQ